MSEAPESNWSSVPVPSDLDEFTLGWPAQARAEAYIVCRVDVPVAQAQHAALLAGGLDLLMQRLLVPADVLRVRDRGGDGGPHRLVLARLPGGRVVPLQVELQRELSEETPRLDSVGTAIASWTSPGLARTSSPPGRAVAPPAPARSSASRAVLSEPGRVGASRPPSFVERPMSVREGVARGKAAQEARLTTDSPLDAWENKVRPRKARGGRMPAIGARHDDPAAAASVAAEAAGSPPHEGPPIWVVVASPALLTDVATAKRALRLLRGSFRVAVAGVADRSLLERRTRRVGVPLDGIYAIPGESARLVAALGCRPDAIAGFVLPDDPTPPGVVRVEVPGPMDIAGAAATLVAKWARSEPTDP